MGTKYEFIIKYIKTEIEHGTFNGKLPSIRALSIKFGCSNSTVIRAYSELETQNIIYALPKSGYFVVEKSLPSNSFEDNNIINFSSGEPHERILPVEEFSKSMAIAMDKYKNTLFRYDSSPGFTPLREIVSKELKEKYNLSSPLEDIHICSGAQQAITLLSLMPFPNNNTKILMEQPSYNIFIGWLKLNNFDVIGIERNSNGIDLDLLEKLFKNGDIKFFYTMPRLQNPLGLSYSEKEKEEIAALAHKYDVYIIEDDYLSDLNDNSCKPLKYYDISNKVIYIKSYSKLLLPGIRLAALVLPKEIALKYSSYKTYHDIMCSLPLQGALYQYIEDNHYSNYIDTVKRLYKSHMNLLNSHLDSLDNINVSYSKPQNGLFSFIQFNDNIKIEALINSLASRDIQIRNGTYFFVDGFESHKPSLRISLTKVNEDKIIRGSNALVAEINRVLNNSPYIKSSILEI